MHPLPIPTRVHPPEIKCQSATPSCPWGSLATPKSPGGRFRHSGWQRHRAAIYAAMQEAGANGKTLIRYQTCGDDLWVGIDQSDPSRITILGDYCHSRWCRPCAASRARIIAGNLLARIGNQPIRLITLTLRHSASPLEGQIDRLYASFRKLRKSQLWQHHVLGGAAICEVKFSRRSRQWHPHLHVLAHGTYIPKNSLSAAWHDATGDSFIVDVGLVRSQQHAAQYVTKYVVKAAGREIENDPKRLAELISALHGRRLVLTFGSWRGWPLMQRLDDTKWIRIEPLDRVIRSAQAGQPGATEIVRLLHRNCAGIVEAYLEGLVRSPPAHCLDANDKLREVTRYEALTVVLLEDLATQELSARL